jgi:hypothetical protein
VAARAADLAAYAGQPHAHRLQRRVQRPALCREARHEGRLQGEPARLNEGLGNWTVERGGHPGARAEARREAAKVWAAPSLPPRCSRRLSPKVRDARRYTIDDHPHLAADRDAAPVRGLPQGGARARSLRHRGVPEALRRLQGRDQLRGRGAAGESACASR